MLKAEGIVKSYSTEEVEIQVCIQQQNSGQVVCFA